MLATLGAFGFLGCDTILPGPPTPEYAAPYADFMIDGSVVDESSSAAIKGIAITFQRMETSADENGEWQIAGTGQPFPKLFFVVATDIDGDENGGSFAPDTLQLDLTKTKKGNGWYSGVYEQHGIEIKMKKAT